MSISHAVVQINHHNAQVLQFDGEHLRSEKIKAHAHYTRQHRSEVRSEHEFFGEVCDALVGITEILVAGSHTALDDFRHYVGKHRPLVAKQVIGWETVDHPTEGQLVAFAHHHFLAHDRMAGTAPLT